MDAPLTTPQDLAALGRGILARYDAEAAAAVVAAVRAEIAAEVKADAVIEAKAALEQSFSERWERALDRLAQDRRQIEDDAEAHLDAKLEAALHDHDLDWQDRLDSLRTRLRDWRARAEVAEAVVLATFGQLLGGTDQRPQYLASGGRGLSAIDRPAVNTILGRAGLRLRSKATASTRTVAVPLPDGRHAAHSLFWPSSRNRQKIYGKVVRCTFAA